MTQNENGWNEWQNYVLAELKDLKVGQKELAFKVEKIKVDIATLKVKASIWGGLAGAIPVLVALAWYILRNFT